MSVMIWGSIKLGCWVHRVAQTVQGSVGNVGKKAAKSRGQENPDSPDVRLRRGFQRRLEFQRLGFSLGF